MKTEDALLIGGAAIAGYYIYKGAQRVAALPERLAVLAKNNLYNDIAGATNQAGLTNTEMVINGLDDTSYAIMTDSHTTPTIAQKTLGDLISLYSPTSSVSYASQGYGMAVMGSGVLQNNGDWISGIHLW